MFRLIGLLILSTLLLGCISTAPQVTDTPTVYSPEGFSLGEDKSNSNGEDGNKGRECESVAPAKLRSDLLAAVNGLRRKGCECMGREMPRVKALAWDEELEKMAVLQSSQTAQGILPFTPAITDVDRIAASRIPVILQNEGAVDVARVMIGLQLNAQQCEQLMRKDIKSMGASKQGCYWSILLE